MRIPFTAICVLTASLALAAPATASPPEHGSGLAQFLAIVPGEEWPAGDGDTYRRYAITVAMQGFIQGLADCDVVEKHGPELQDNDLIDGTCALTGSVAGSDMGSVDFHLSGICRGLTGRCDGQLSALRDTQAGGLDGLKSLDAVWEIPIHAPHTPLTYEAEARFKP